MHHLSDYSHCPLQAKEGGAAAVGSSATPPAKASPTPVISTDPAPALPGAFEKSKSEQTPTKNSQGISKEAGNSIAVRATTGPAGQVCLVKALILCVQVQHFFNATPGPQNLACAASLLAYIHSKNRMQWSDAVNILQRLG